MRDELRKKYIRRKAFLLACFYMIFNMYAYIKTSSPKQRNMSYEINEDYERGGAPFASYHDFDIYFGSEEYLESYIFDSDNICVVDGRGGNNPTLRVCNSYRITNEEDMFNILGVIMEYEEKYPSKWCRTLEGLQIEWYVHNVCYEMNILIKSSKSVDLDMRDAILYEDRIVKLFLGK